MSLAVRVVGVTIVLAALAVLTVGVYLSTVIADGLFEQRQDRVLEESATVRSELTGALRGTVGDTSTQTQDTAATFVQSLRTPDAETRRDAALVPVEGTSSVSTISTDRSMLDLVDEDFGDQVGADPSSLTFTSVSSPDGSGHAQPQILVGTRVVVPGSGSYDLYLLYSLAAEQKTLSFVHQAMAGAAVVLLTLMVGIAIVVARLVTRPLRRASEAAERIAGGDLSSRVEITGGDELADLGRSFNDMATTLQHRLDELTELSRVQQRFVADVSHELRTPLTTIRMATAVLDEHREEFSEDVGRTTELLSAQVRRFETLLADLLEISRFDAGAAVLEAHEVDLDQLVQDTAADVRPLAGSRGTLLDLHLSPQPVRAVVDPRRIDRILRNLLTNAIEHGAGGPVSVRTAGNDTAVAVTVQDFGHGIDPEEAARVFDRFWRADPSRARTIGGTGLGLAISIEDAHLHGGWLQAWGQAGEGAVFRLTLPCRPGGHIDASPLALEQPFTERERQQAQAAADDAVETPVQVRADTLPPWQEASDDT
jgi:two-component system sensor histidine kinase MtrB